MYGDLGLPSRQDPPLGFVGVVQRNASNTFGTNLAAGAAGVSERAALVRLRGPSPDL